MIRTQQAEDQLSAGAWWWPKRNATCPEIFVSQEDYGRSKLGGFVDRYFKHSYLKQVETLVQDEKVSEQELLDFLNELKKQ